MINNDVIQKNIMLVGKFNDIKRFIKQKKDQINIYKCCIVHDGEDIPDKGIVAKAMKEIRGKYSFDEDKEPEQEVVEEETEEPRGLMARRGDR